MILAGAVSEWVNVESGVPQGSVIGPVLFILYINDLPKFLECFCEIFADDTKLISIIKSMESCLRLEKDLDKVLEWTKNWLVQLNKEKCKVMHCGAGNPKFDYMINQTCLLKTESERDLGVTFTNNLKWSNQVNEAAKKANRVLGTVRRTIKFHTKESVCRL